ncbi:MAG: hypothetical protein BRD41_05605, partial [Bacteroidetes bacterium QS_1_63_11]
MTDVTFASMPGRLAMSTRTVMELLALGLYSGLSSITGGNAGRSRGDREVVRGRRPYIEDRHGRPPAKRRLMQKGRPPAGEAVPQVQGKPQSLTRTWTLAAHGASLVQLIKRLGNFLGVCRSDAVQFREVIQVAELRHAVDPSAFEAGCTGEVLRKAWRFVGRGLFVGRLVEGKRPQDALDAIIQVIDYRPDVKFFYCGDGPLRDRLESRVAEAGKEMSIYFLGHVEYDQMPSVYRGADLLILPSQAEGFPRTILEAFAS